MECVKDASETVAAAHPKKKKKRRTKARSKMDEGEEAWFQVEQVIQKDESRNTKDLQVAREYIQELKSKVGMQPYLNHVKEKIASYQVMVEQLTKSRNDKDEIIITSTHMKQLNLKDCIAKLQNDLNKLVIAIDD